ncbi:MAG: serine hydrolase [Sphingomonas sanxanigenens]|uniref:Serine hydrolase n=1 Tax=Sphingomonas sanxanigenens TaxID=397260 RepID=A0A2W5A2L0_9SPHN|nr:MAG: serine hydrolase [Sphingomonas sanxanigenens]
MQIRLWAILASLLVGGCVSAPPPPPARGAWVRVAFDARGVRAVEAGGVADPATGRRVTADDPVRVASISKLAVAMGVMRLVEAGTLDLDSDVSRWLGWRLRNPAYPDTPITLRLLLSHRSSLTDGIDYVLPLGATLQGALADPRAWDGAHAPGSWFRYTNLNFPVIASIMEKATGERFDLLMKRLVFQPLDLDACMNWSTCSDSAIARAVTLTNAEARVLRDNLGGLRPACPVLVPANGDCALADYSLGANGALFSPQGGMRISAKGLARIGQLFLDGGEGFLTPASLATLIGPDWVYDGTNGVTGEDADDGFLCTYGLALQTLATQRKGCRDDPFGDKARRIGHAGSAYGLRSGLWVDRKAKRGVAYFVTAVPDDEKGRRSAFTAAEEWLARP